MPPAVPSGTAKFHRQVSARGQRLNSSKEAGDGTVCRKLAKCSRSIIKNIRRLKIPRETAVMLKHFPCAALVFSLFCACPCDQEKQRLANSTTQNRAANTVCGGLRPLRSAWTQQTAALARTVCFYASGTKKAVILIALHKSCRRRPRGLTKTPANDILQAIRLQKAVADVAGT